MDKETLNVKRCMQNMLDKGALTKEKNGFRFSDEFIKRRIFFLKSPEFFKEFKDVNSEEKMKLLIAKINIMSLLSIIKVIKDKDKDYYFRIIDGIQPLAKIK